MQMGLDEEKIVVFQEALMRQHQFFGAVIEVSNML